MTKTVDYHYSLMSPWSYLGGPRLDRIAAAAGATVNFKPINLGKVFPATGGLPLAKRAPERQAYRMAELGRWRDHLGMLLNLEPRHFPAPEALAACMVIAARRAGADAGRLTNAIMRAVWAEERNIAEAETLRAIAGENGIDGDALLAEAETEVVADEYAADTDEAIARGVFGAPTYIYEGELYWGQDRLDFLERALG
ncbi:MAG: 2-hydroxychromene-2-carboxylate isomerase [Proteobacteria bacterium]|nr:2-hydroxychromene-2-carboxylate isomerase [Pseudomonadota bacterium]